MRSPLILIIAVSTCIHSLAATESFHIQTVLEHPDVIEPFDIAHQPSTGDFIISSVGTGQLIRYSPETRQATAISTLSKTHPAGLAIDSVGNIYIGGWQYRFVRRISPSSSSSSSSEVWFEQRSSPVWLAFDWEGHLITSNEEASAIFRISPGRDYQETIYSASTDSDVDIRYQAGVDVDGEGNIWICDRFNGRVLKVSSTGDLIAQYPPASADSNDDITYFEEPYGIAIDKSNGNVYVTEFSTNQVKRISSDGQVTLIPGQFNRPSGMAIDPSNGLLYIADRGNSQIKRIVICEDNEMPVDRWSSECACTPGYFYSDTIQGCDKCPVGTWKGSIGNDQCEQCLWPLIPSANATACILPLPTRTSRLMSSTLSAPSISSSIQIRRISSNEQTLQMAAEIIVMAIMIMVIVLIPIGCVIKILNARLKQELTMQSSSQIFASGTNLISNSTTKFSPDEISASKSVTAKSNTFFSKNRTTLVGQDGISMPGFLQFRNGNDFVGTKMLSSGGEGTVYLGKAFHIKLKQYGTDIVLKKLHETPVLSTLQIDSFYQEVSLMYLLRDNRNIACLLGYSVDPLTIIMKFYVLGNLSGFLRSNPRISSTMKLKFAKDISLGISSLHHNDIAHCDLKPENILVDQDNEEQLYCVISDFGVSCLTTSKVLNVDGFVPVQKRAASLLYASPEVLARLKRIDSYGFKYHPVKSDIYSYGIIIYDILTTRRPWR